MRSATLAGPGAAATKRKIAWRVGSPNARACSPMAAGMLAASPPLLRLGGTLLAATGAAVTANLASGPVRLLRRAAARPAPAATVSP